MIGPGKYDDEVTLVRQRTEAAAVILIVVEGKKGSGFSVHSNELVVADLPRLLRMLASSVEADQQRDDQPEDRPWRVPGGAA